MILVADAGSTKTDWAWIEHGKLLKTAALAGLNPIQNTLPDPRQYFGSKATDLATVSEVHFFGSGVASPVQQQKIRQFLKLAGVCTEEVEVESDIVGAARALKAEELGIVSILGTGSNSCSFKQGKIVESIPSLGFAIGDEGSGSAIGKLFLKEYFYQKLPSKVYKEIKLQRVPTLTEIYRSETPAEVLASYAKYVIENRTSDWAKGIIRKSLTSFIVNRILPYADLKESELFFVGSIAYFCKEDLTECLKAFKLKPSTILRKPIDGLVDFYSKL